ncbi:MAG TPA: NAD(P)H-dependent oxidoreductase subunit E, partial [Bacteroidales bacterium]|nr:NAD(P)H-dependent oxidoreductase subunit E [Bacteroidales bacterium]
MNDDSNIQETIDRIVRLHGSGDGSVIPLLQEIQREYRYLPGEAMRLLSKSTGIPVARLEGVASFYGQFRFEPAGRHIVHVCTGTACHVKGALVVYDAFARALKLTDGLLTDAAGLFTLEKVACLGCCTLAPVVKIDQVTYGHVKPGDAEAILNDFLARKTAPDGKMHKANGSAPMQGEIRVGLGSCCVASGSAGVKQAIDEVLEETGIRVGVRQVGCVGVCNQVPMIEIVKNGEPGIFYTRLKPNEVREILLTHFKPAGLFGRVRTSLRRLLGRVVEAPAPATFERYDEEQRDNPLCDFLDPQVAIATEHRGKLSPLNIAEYRSGGGFAALERCLAGFQPGEIIEEIVSSGLRGRGGAGFPTGEKWRLAQRQKSDQKYVICNGDEGDPGAFMDRMLLESYPFRIIEGMLIAGFATGATEGLFYIRAEYPLAVTRVKEALEICRREGVLGERILNSGFRFSIRVFEGAGAFVCGEETALIASVEGYRGTPRLRPPYPVVSGLNGKPTLVNNAETLSLVPWIIRNGAGKFAAIGTPGSKGTKVFALAGKVRRGGLIEVPMGITIRKVVEEIGGGMQG